MELNKGLASLRSSSSSLTSPLLTIGTIGGTGHGGTIAGAAAELGVPLGSIGGPHGHGHGTICLLLYACLMFVADWLLDLVCLFVCLFVCAFISV